MYKCMKDVYYLIQPILTIVNSKMNGQRFSSITFVLSNAAQPNFAYPSNSICLNMVLNFTSPGPAVMDFFKKSLYLLINHKNRVLTLKDSRRE